MTEEKNKILASDNYDIEAEKLNKKYAFLTNLHPLIIVFGIIILVSLATYFIPGGNFERTPITVIGLERELIIPGSFQFGESVPQGFSQLWTSFMEGAIEASDISWTILLCAGAFTAIIGTGAISNGITSLAAKFEGKSILLIPVCVFAFGLGGATYGMYEDAIPFILVLCPLALAIGYDSMVGLMTVHFSVAVGASAAFMNPFCVGVGQALAEVPMMSGIGVRIALWFIMMTATSIYIIRYAQKVKKNPEYSLSYSEDMINRHKYEDFTTAGLKKITGRQTIVLVLLALSFAIMIYGVIKLEWWFNEIGSIFLFMGIVLPLIGGLSINEVINKNIEGMTTVITAVILISASRVITAVLVNSNTMDTILYYISNSLTDMPKAISVIIMFFVSSISMLFVQSSSGLAATLMPIMAPLADLLGITRQTIVSAYALGTGTFGWIVPWEGINFAMCALAGVNFFKYLKKAAHFVFTVYIPIAVVALVLMTVLNYQ